MAERPPSHPDDWFDEPEPLNEELRSSLLVRRPRAVERTSRMRGADDWTRPVAAVAWVRRSSRRRLPSSVVALAGGVVLLGVLAAFGMFGSASPSAGIRPAREAIIERTQTAAPTTTRSVPPSPSTALNPGDGGAGLESLQRALAYRGFPVGKLDGVYGPGARGALARFQRRRG